MLVQILVLVILILLNAYFAATEIAFISLNDAKIEREAKNGNKEAFTSLIMEIENDLYKIAKTRISNEADIDDVIQETMIEAYRNIRKLREPKKFKKWVITILVNKCNRIYKRKYKKDVSIDEYDLDKYIVSNNYKNIDDDLNFYSLLKQLKYEERIVIILYYMEQYSIKDIKEILKMNENTVRTHLFRARKKIKENYEKGVV